MIKKRISLKDIALKTGVSTALVSYVLNNQKEDRINKEVAQKIRDTAAKLNYRPNHIAKSLRINKTNTIGLIVADISNPFFSGLARIIEDEAYKHGYTVIIGSSDENEKKFENLIDSLLNHQVDGLIILPPGNSASHIIQLKKQGTPFVLADRYFPGIDTNSVSLDNYAAAYQAVQHLIEHGFKRIGMIGYNSPLFHLQERKRGYQCALKNGKIRAKKTWLKEVDISNNQTEIEKAAASLLAPVEPVDAMLFGSNGIATCALRYINSLSITVPLELGIASFDETDVFDFFYAPLTHIKQPLHEIGQLSVKILLENIEKKKKTRQVVLPAQLIIRRSTMK